MSHCELVAELGHNHQGSVATAEKMIRVAADAGFDAVKLQKRDNRTLYTPAFYDSPYTSENAYAPTYGEHREILELDEAEFGHLANLTDSLGLRFIVSVFDEASLEFFWRLEVDALKIASGDLTNLPLLREVAQTDLPVILSTGGGTLEDVTRAVRALGSPAKGLTILQCTASYPASYEELDLGVIPTLAEWFPFAQIGASLHDNGIAMAVAAYALGARVIEKHVTLDRTMKGTDHAFSLEPQGQRKLVRDIRRAEVGLGATKRVHDSELPAIRKMGKSPYPVNAIRAGTNIGGVDVSYRSPQDGMTPAEFEEACEAGAVATRDIDAWEPIRWESVGDRVLSRH